MRKSPTKSVQTKKTTSTSDVAAVGSELPVGVDRVNNISQKEEALYAVGITRRKAYQVLADGLVATKRIVGYDSRGMEVVSVEPDQDKRHKSVESIMRLFGDSKEFLAVNTQVNNVMDVKAIVEAIKANGK